ncbi:MAG: hypothetical protein LBT92_03185 [Rickettsiales bacterium]|nr:hypothetical protein [Rickettsiales bacterium]
MGMFPTDDERIGGLERANRELELKYEAFRDEAYRCWEEMESCGIHSGREDFQKKLVERIELSRAVGDNKSR